jgi:hypothetical protein
MYTLNQIQDFRAQSDIRQELDSFHQQIGLTFKEASNGVLHVEHGFVQCWNLHTSQRRSEIPRMFL